MSIIYTISSILTFILTILIKKSEEKLEIVKTIVLTLIAFIGYNALVCFILNLTKIPITLISLSIVNFLLSLAFLILILKKKEIQKFEFRNKNLIIVVFYALLSIVMMSFIHGYDGEIRYLTGDPEAHYGMARTFSEMTTLGDINEDYFNWMFLSYTNEGIWCKVFYPYIGTIHMFNIYIVFEILFYALVGICFTFLVDKYCQNKYFNYFVVTVFSLLFILGYPLNAWLTGFHYLVVSLIYIITILYSINIKEIDLKHKIALMGLLNFGIMFSYCLFCPVIYFAEFIYYILKYWKKDRKQLIYLIFFTLFLPGIMGLGFVLTSGVNKGTELMATEGYIYKNIWANFILYLPFSIYGVYQNIKNKKRSIIDITAIVLVIYIFILFILMLVNKCSEYYLFKNYFVLWTIISIMNIKGIIDFSSKGKNEKIISITYICIYILLLIVLVLNVVSFQTKHANDKITNMMEIYTFNNSKIQRMGTVLTKSEYNLFYEYEKIIDNKWKDLKNEDALFISDWLRETWIKCFTGFENDIKKYKENNKEELFNRIEQNVYKYIIVTKGTDADKEYSNHINKDNYDVIFENETGLIYLRK